MQKYTPNGWRSCVLNKLSNYLRHGLNCDKRGRLTHGDLGPNHLQTTLETSGSDVNLHSKRVGKGEIEYVLVLLGAWFELPQVEACSRKTWIELPTNHTRNEWGRCRITLETSGKDINLHSKRVKKTCLSFTDGLVGRCPCTTLGLR
jgi:hypothetical protein